jgi:spoIIIJ-associated protein
VEWVVTTGRTIEEALETALDQLGVDEQDAEVEVLQEPQRGLFGRLRTEAQVRARVRPSAPPPKVDRRDRRRRDRRGRDGERGAGSRTRARNGRSGSGSGSGSGASGSGSAGSGSGGGRSERTGPAVAAGSSHPNGSVTDVAAGGGDQAARAGGRDAARSGQGGGARRRRRGTGREGAKPEGAGVVSESSTTVDAETAIDIEAQRIAVEEFLRGLLDAFGRPDATVAVTVVEDDTLEAAVDGSELGVLVGQKGVTLQSLQELVRSMVQRRFVGQAHARVRVDVAGYRERRRIALERFTIDVAQGVLESGVAKALDPMGAADRKVVHDSVNGIEGVETVSEGEDADRHVVIRPVS